MGVVGVKIVTVACTFLYDPIFVSRILRGSEASSAIYGPLGSKIEYGKRLYAAGKTGRAVETGGADGVARPITRNPEFFDRIRSYPQVQKLLLNQEFMRLVREILEKFTKLFNDPGEIQKTLIED